MTSQYWIVSGIVLLCGISLCTSKIQSSDELLKTILLAQDGDAPYHVTLTEVQHANDRDEFIWIYSGIVIDKDSVLIPAHALQRINHTLRHYIVAGIGYDSVDVTEDFVYEVKDFIINPGYNASTLKDDIAIINIKGEFNEGINLKPAKIASQPFTSNKTCTFSFVWKFHFWLMMYSMYKIEVVVPNREMCTDVFNHMSLVHPEVALCASATDDSWRCYHKNGATLFCDDEIVGFQISYWCPTNNIFLELYHYRDWIAKFID